MAAYGRKDGGTLGSEKPQPLISSIQYVRGDALPRLVMRLTCAVLRGATDVVQKRRGVYEFTIEPAGALEIQDPGDASHIERMASAMAAKHALLFGAIYAGKMLLVHRTVPYCLNAIQHRPPNFSGLESLYPQ